MKTINMLAAIAMLCGSIVFSQSSVVFAQSNPVIDNLLNQVQPGTAPLPPGQADVPAGNDAASGQMAPGQVKVFDGVPETRDIVDALAPSEATKDLTVIPRAQQRVGLFAITFDYNSDELTPQAREILNRLGAALRDPRLVNYRFTFEGNTDAAGSYEYNDDLSLRRARAAAHYLYQRFGVNPDMLYIRGNGKRRLYDASRPYDRINRNVQVAVAGRR